MQSLEARQTPRIQLLLERLRKSSPEIFAERALLATESYRETEALPICIRRAKLIAKVLTDSTAVINTGELIVGCKTPKPLGSPLYPEVACNWIEAEIRNDAAAIWQRGNHLNETE